MVENEKTQFTNGMFSLPTGQNLTGSLSLDGEDTILHLWGKKIENIDTLDKATITGILENQKKASLIDCIVTRQEQFFGKDGVFYHYRLFPHYVIIGTRHRSSSDKTITKVSFVIDDAMTLFHDRFAFGTVDIPPDRVKDIGSVDLFEKIQFEGDRPIFAYWTGKMQIFSADTILGRISACHQPSFDMGGPHGACISNRIVVFVEFFQSKSVRDTDIEIRKVLRFFHTILGRPQKLIELQIIDDGDPHPESSELHLSMYPNHSRRSSVREPDFRDILIDAATDREGFSRLLCEWLLKEETWRIARSRFASGWSRARNYDPDRIVGAANMFDLLPDNAVPSNSTLEGCLEDAVQQSKELFKGLPQSDKRNRILGDLGRLSKPSLKEKIRYRSQVISSRIGECISDISEVTDAAVDLRNLFVHGSTASATRKEKLQESIGFLTDTLEFVFCASDLIESGWNIEVWHQKQKGAGHPFADYLRSYPDDLARFRK
ncbi:MAG: hypothetical protein F4160_20195 [Rhodospirillaceae bacterium]|nr:hypothetical protein [Rhodospirillaceae bacterium]MYH39113.1 hypothetical protein [Rhodospirillaceae bacterium]MYK14488.1 hypothetical protein [Rhodospirillaceae bacterium]